MIDMNNGNYIESKGYKFSSEEVFDGFEEWRSKVGYNNSAESFAEWLDLEHHEFLTLSIGEKKSLGRMLKRINGSPIAIFKHSDHEKEFISILYSEPSISFSVNLESFPEGTQYRGMENGTPYTPAELGL